MNEFKREIGFYENHFKDFYFKQSLAVRNKIDWALLLLKTTRIVPEKFLNTLRIQTDYGKCGSRQETEYSESSVFLMKEI